MKHTPGPWTTLDGEGTTIRAHQGRFTVARISSGLTSDARLIAAAPALLEALTHWLEIDCAGSGCQNRLHENARAAIKAATEGE